MTIEHPRYAEAVDTVAADPAVQRMAAELRLDNMPRETFTHASNTPTMPFMERANDAYQRYGGSAYGLFLGTVANAVLRLAYDSPLRRYEVRTGSTGGDTVGVGIPPLVTFEVINDAELGLRIADLVRNAHNLDREQVVVELYTSVAEARREDTGERLESFAVDEVIGR
ncbi:hypothetical protein FB384_004932 [Prauserella sediminis]|uniref:Uncharacterized protein n=1 Tax=Prauserella sediminis TaxID=577680 RepID=A0A839Y016_9PSEU|nr:hypothetical protein [Prauserella sediminis]MBB3665973.1 hypothetical protein [Prauserella sediminis]